MEWFVFLIVMIWLGGNGMLFTEGINDENMWVVIIAVIMDLFLVYAIFSAKADAKEKERIEKENKRFQDLVEENSRFVQKYKLKLSVEEIKVIPFVTESTYQIKEITSTVKTIKNEIYILKQKCDIRKNKIDEILNACHDFDEEKKYMYLNQNINELDSLLIEYNSFNDLISKHKVELINENKEIQKQLLLSFNKFSESKKCFTTSNDKSSISNFIINKKPKELSLFKYKYKPLILYLDDFYFCLFSSCILIFDKNGLFSNAVSTSYLSIKISKFDENVIIRNDEAQRRKYTDSDSRLIKKGNTTSRWTHSRQDGGPDLRYSSNSLIHTRMDLFEYGIIEISVGNSKHSFYVSSESALNSMDKIEQIYQNNVDNSYRSILSFMYLMEILDKQNKDISSLVNYYKSIINNTNYFCKIYNDI